MQQQQEQQQQRDSSGGDRGQHLSPSPPSSSSSSLPLQSPLPPPLDPLVLLSPEQARRLLDDARGLASEGRPVAALQTLLAALSALGAPRAALQTFERAVEALTLRRGGGGGGGGGGGEEGDAGQGREGEEREGQQRPAAAVPVPPSLASLLASLSLEASTRLGALEGEKREGDMAPDDGEGPYPAAVAAAAASALLSEEAAARADGASVRCGECGAVVAATRAEAHAMFWCSRLGSSGGGGAGRGG